ncbi:MAG: SRPBCC domain-containing protein [Planctomycetes bacterium]|nr:SRPBCC domain-containing protein [Planctomycetota bacterium]
MHPDIIDSALFVAAGDDVRAFSCEATIHAPRADVWAFWTDGAAFARVYGRGRPELAARIYLAVGGRYEWLWDGVTGSNDCQVLCWLPQRLLAFSWNAPPSQPQSRELRTWVVVELAEVDEGTHVTLTHAGFGHEPHWEETRAYFQTAWPGVLATLREGLERAR